MFVHFIVVVTFQRLPGVVFAASCNFFEPHKR